MITTAKNTSKTFLVELLNCELVIPQTVYLINHWSKLTESEKIQLVELSTEEDGLVKLNVQLTILLQRLKKADQDNFDNFNETVFQKVEFVSDCIDGIFSTIIETLANVSFGTFDILTRSLPSILPVITVCSLIASPFIHHNHVSTDGQIVLSYNDQDKSKGFYLYCYADCTISTNASNGFNSITLEIKEKNAISPYYKTVPRSQFQLRNDNLFFDFKEMENYSGTESITLKSVN